MMEQYLSIIITKENSKTEQKSKVGRYNTSILSYLRNLVSYNTGIASFDAIPRYTVIVIEKGYTLDLETINITARVGFSKGE